MMLPRRIGAAALREMCRADEEISRANVEISRVEEEISRAFPEELMERCKSLRKWESSDKMESLIIDLCDFKPLNLNEIAELLNRKSSSVRYQYINPLIKGGRLFYTIPEMRNHPNQKYTTNKRKL